MITRREKFLVKKLYELYAELYKNSTPSVDFYELMKKTPWSVRLWKNSLYQDASEKRIPIEIQEKLSYNEKIDMYEVPADTFKSNEEAAEYSFAKRLPWEDYKIDSKLYKEIVDKWLKSHNFSSTEKQALRWEAYLGAGPTQIYEEDKENEDI